MFDFDKDDYNYFVNHLGILGISAKFAGIDVSKDVGKLFLKLSKVTDEDYEPTKEELSSINLLMQKILIAIESSKIKVNLTRHKSISDFFTVLHTFNAYDSYRDELDERKYDDLVNKLNKIQDTIKNNLEQYYLNEAGLLDSTPPKNSFFERLNKSSLPRRISNKVNSLNYLNRETKKSLDEFLQVFKSDSRIRSSSGMDAINAEYVKKYGKIYEDVLFDKFNKYLNKLKIELKLEFETVKGTEDFEYEYFTRLQTENKYLSKNFEKFKKILQEFLLHNLKEAKKEAGIEQHSIYIPSKKDVLAAKKIVCTNFEKDILDNKHIYFHHTSFDNLDSILRSGIYSYDQYMTTFKKKTSGGVGRTRTDCVFAYSPYKILIKKYYIENPEKYNPKFGSPSKLTSPSITFINRDIASAKIYIMNAIDNFNRVIIIFLDNSMPFVRDETQDQYPYEVVFDKVINPDQIIGIIIQMSDTDIFRSEYTLDSLSRINEIKGICTKYGKPLYAKYTEYDNYDIKKLWP